MNDSYLQLAKRSLKPGLVCGTVRIEIQDVSKSHRKKCACCGKVPTVRRTIITYGSGRGAHTIVLCRFDSIDWLHARSKEFIGAAAYIAGHAERFRYERQPWERKKAGSSGRKTTGNDVAWPEALDRLAAVEDPKPLAIRSQKMRRT